MRVCGKSPARLSGGPSDFDRKHSISKERQDYGDRSGPRILEIDPVILKLSRFPQVQSERERTLVYTVSDVATASVHSEKTRLKKMIMIIIITRNVLLSAQMGERASVVLICIITSRYNEVK